MKKTCVVVLSFGMGSALDCYGKSNLAIAKLVSTLKFPIIAQWEIADLLEFKYDVSIFRRIEKEDKYLDTYAVLLAAKQTMLKFGFTEVIYCGHQDHLPRIRKIAEKLEIVESKIKTRNFFIPYDVDSTQWWTRSKFLFKSREIAINIYYLFKK